MTYYHRLIETTLRRYLKSFSVVGLTGPRQSGKSTLLRHELGEVYDYVTFDEQSVVDRFYYDPEQFISQYPNRVIFDEVQKVPELFNIIKIQVDNDRNRYGKYILTGSSQFSLMHRITESLAGRMGILQLLPLQYLEVPSTLRKQSIYSGSYPEIVKQHFENREAWYSSYITTYLEKDVRTLSQIGDMRDFSRFIRLLAANTSQLLNMSHYAHDLGVSMPTIKRWISILEASYIIFLLKPYYKNLGKRIVKSPKVYFIDTGLAAYLTQINDKTMYENGPMRGALFENYIVSEIYKRELLKDNPRELSFYRTSNGQEVDVVIDAVTKKTLIEIKSGSTFKPAMLSAADQLLEKHDQAYLIYNGKTMPFTDQSFVMNYEDYLNG